MKGRLFSVGYMFLLTLFFTGAVSAVKEVNEERIRLNEETKLKAVVLDVLGIPLPPGVPRRAAIAKSYDERVRTGEVEGRPLYIGYDEEGARITGYAFAVGGAGFWGPIEAMVSLDARAARIAGVNFTRNAETPGLGARMTEEWFTEQFRGLSLDPEGEDAPFFRLVQPGTSSGESELDAITGATETSRSIEKFINREIRLLLPSLKALSAGRT